MGDRALIQLTSGKDVSPVLYLHWGGSEVADILQRAEARMKGRAGDTSYAFARLVQEAIGNDRDNTGYGVWNQADRLTDADSHGDAGCFVVDVTADAWETETFGGYGFVSADDDEEGEAA